MKNISKIHKGQNSKITSTSCHLPEPQKVYFGLAEGKWKKVITTIKSPSTTKNIYSRRHFQVMRGI